VSSRLRLRFWVNSAAAIAATLGLAACGGGGVSGASRVTVYVSMPLQGPSAPAGRAVVRGARMALAAAGGRAGKLRVRAVYLDDAAGSGGRARWSQAVVGANARRATEDTSAVAYIGDFESGATRTSEAITNAAHLLQISPASTAVDLVRPFLGSDQLPAVEEEGGERTFGRVIPDDQAQAVAGAVWVRKLGERRVAVRSDSTRFGRTMATAFREALLGPRVVRRGAQLLYYAGVAGDEPRGPTARFHGPVMASDALLEPFSAGSTPVASLATSAAQDPAQLPPAGQRFARSYRRRYGRAPERYAAYGFEAMALALDSIRRAGDSGDQRQAVVDSFFATRGRRSILGTYSIDAVGNTTLPRLTGYRFRAGVAGSPRLLRIR
jgi:branched-chain amino acid transport system substrate-binding protein